MNEVPLNYVFVVGAARLQGMIFSTEMAESWSSFDTFVSVVPGCSGVQIQLECGMLLEGFRPAKIVRFYPASWPFITVPMEESFHGRE